MPRDLFDIIDERSKAAHYKPREGVILEVGPVTALVQRVGSVTPVPCEYNPADGVEVGKHCVVDWVPGRRYVITSVFNGRHALTPGAQTPGAFELFPPGGVATSSAIAGCILLTWEVPAQLDVTFEVQRNSSAIDAGATTVGTTRGNSYIDTVGAAAYFRARSITTLWRYSGWSAWVSGTPGTITGDLDELDDVTITAAANDDLLAWDADDSRWENQPLEHFTDRILTGPAGYVLVGHSGRVLIGSSS